MIRTFLFLGLLALSPVLGAQSDPAAEVAVRGCLLGFFDAIHQADTVKFKRFVHPRATFGTVRAAADGGTSLTVRTAAELMRAVGSAPVGAWEERLLSVDVEVDGPLAAAWTPYRFYVDGRLAHCGTNAIQLAPTGPRGAWQIVSVTDTRRTEPCPEAEPAGYPVADSVAIARMMDDWHAAAARADFEGFFGPIAEDGIYLGTDLSERWTKAEFARFSQPYFERGKAWSFRPYDRRVYFSADGRTAWFEEKLDTWMGECRGSGVLRKHPGPKLSWQIVHYDLAVAVPNKAIERYLKVLRKLGLSPRLPRG
jgi:hypothetical protein